MTTEQAIVCAVFAAVIYGIGYARGLWKGAAEGLKEAADARVELARALERAEAAEVLGELARAELRRAR